MPLRLRVRSCHHMSRVVYDVCVRVCVCGGQGSIPLIWSEAETFGLSLKPRPELELTKDNLHLTPLTQHLNALQTRCRQPSTEPRTLNTKPQTLNALQTRCRQP
jgi:hypothetical protein